MSIRSYKNKISHYLWREGNRFEEICHCGKEESSQLKTGLHRVGHFDERYIRQINAKDSDDIPCEETEENLPNDVQKFKEAKPIFF